MNRNIMLISFYNPKSLGLRYIENALIQSGYKVTVVFFKGFNSVNPKRASADEINLLKALIEKKKPMLIGLSVMTSLYLETVEALNKEIRKFTDAPVIWGGVYATMFYEKCMSLADFVIRGEGEEAFTELADAVSNGRNDYAEIQNIVYRADGKVIANELRDLLTDLDKFGVPDIGNSNKYFIENNSIQNIDPQVNSLNYEISASRGCPFACSYCCAINLSRINYKKGKYVRFRDVDKVIEELKNAKAKIKNLKVIHFWDEIFCDDDVWIDKFTKRYKDEINLPFEIWGHPLKTDKKLITKLRKAGLYKVVMGIQSGSPYIRKEIFNRPEKQEDIIKASKILSKCGVPQVIYDFMLRHPFETHETLRETYDLCMKLEPPFELQLHGLNFLPGTDIVTKALDMKLVSPDEMEQYMYAPIEKQYDMYWKIENNDQISNYIYKLIYLTQFPILKKKTAGLSADPASIKNQERIEKLFKYGRILTKLRYYYKKGIIVLKGTFGIR